MGAGGMYQSYPYPPHNTVYNRPQYNQVRYPPPGHIPPYGYPPNMGMSYGRGFHRPHTPMNYGPMINGFPHGVFHNPIGGSTGFFNSPRDGGGGGLQSAPPSATPDGNIHLHRFGEYRAHFDEQ